MAEWRVEVLWRLRSDSLDNDTLTLVADAADEHDWAVSRWEDGPGFYIAGYVEAVTVAEAAQKLYDQVGAWMEDMPVSGDRVGVEAIPVEVAEIRADKPTIPELASAADAAEILQVSRQRIHQLATENPRFPAPVARVATGPLWTVKAIEWFDSIWERKPGRPSKQDKHEQTAAIKEWAKRQGARGAHRRAAAGL